MFDITNMAKIDPNPEVYERLMALKPVELSPNAWAVQAGVSRTVWSDMRKHGSPTRTTLEKLLAIVGVSIAQFEAMRGSVRTEVRGTGISPQDLVPLFRPGQQTKPVPLVGSAFGGEWEDGIEMTELHLADVLDYLARPPSLAADDNAYVVEIVGESMAPRFEPGERAFVSPKAPVRPGDDVIVQLKGSGEDQLADRVTMVLIKRLGRRTPKHVELIQFNPPRTFEVPVARVAAIHRVRGRL